MFSANSPPSSMEPSPNTLTEDMSSSETPASNTPTADMSSSQMPASNTPTADMSSSETPASNTPSANTSSSKTPQSNKALERCVMCDATPAKKCSSCHSIAYCSTACQNADWRLHKTVCKDFTKDDRPSELHIRGFLFPEHSDLPKLIWVESEMSRYARFPQPRLEVDGLLGTGTVRNRTPITYSVLRGFRLYHTVEILTREDFYFDGSKRNAAVYNTTRRVSAVDWNGPIVVLAQAVTNPTKKYQDVTGVDLRIAVDHFIVSGNKTQDNVTYSGYSTWFGENRKRLPNNSDPNSQKKTVKGVKINCSGEIRVFGCGEFSAVEVPIDHPVIVSPTIPELPELLGLKVLVGKWPSNILWEPHSGYSKDNPLAVSLNVHTDARHPLWGTFSAEWRRSPGNVVVLRADHKPITPNQVEALCRYCAYKIHHVMDSMLYQMSYLNTTKASDRTRINQQVNKDVFVEGAFREFFEELKKEKAKEKGGEDWPQEVFPCDMTLTLRQKS